MCCCENVHTHHTSGADRNSRDNFLGGSVVKSLPAMQEAHRRHGFHPWVGKILWSKMAICSRILGWEISRTEQSGGLQFMQTWLSMQGHSTHSPHLPGVSKTDAMVPILQLQHPLLSLHVGLRVIPGAHVRGPKRMKHCLGKGSDPNRLFLHNLGSQCIYREVPPALSPFPLSLQLYIPSLGPSSTSS